MTTSFNKEKAEKVAIDSIESIEKSRLLSFKVVLKHKDIVNKPEDEDILMDDEGKPNGPQNLSEELHLNKFFTCFLCKNVPVAPVVQCKDCEQLYCQTCLDVYKKQIEENLKKVKVAAEAEKTTAKKEGENNEDKAAEKDDKNAEEVVEQSNEKPAKKNKKKAGESNVAQLPEIAKCKSKKCKNKNCEIKTEPLSRILRNIMCNFEFGHGDDQIDYEKFIKQQKEEYKERLQFSCPYGCEDDNGNPKMCLQKDHMKEHLVNDCPKMVLECSMCNLEYVRSDFYKIEKHDCFKNLLSQIQDCKDKIEKLQQKRVDEEIENKDRKVKIEELEQKYKDLQKKKDQVYQERQKIEQKHNDQFGARYIHNDGQKVPLKLPKDFISVQTIDDAEDQEKKLLDGPIFFDNQRKIKKGGDWHTRKRMKLIFKRKIAFNAISFQFWQGESPKPKVEEQKEEADEAKVVENSEDKEKKVEEKKEEEEEAEVLPGNKAYMYIYIYDNKRQQFTYSHFNNVPKERKEGTNHQLRWRNCQTICTDFLEFQVDVYNDLDRQQFEKMLLDDIRLYF